MAEPNILNLDDIVDRTYKVRIGKTLYDVRNADEFATLSGARFKIIGARIEELAKLSSSKKLTENQVIEFEQLTGEFVRAILVDVPPEAVKKLKAVQRLQAIQFFFQLPGIKAIFAAAAKGAKTQPPRRSPSKRSSRSSTRSTGATQ